LPCGSRFPEADGGALAVVEDVRTLVDNKICEEIVLGEVLRQDEAGGFLAQPDQVGRILPEQLRAKACEVQVRDRPGGTVEGAFKQEPLDICARDEDDGLLDRRHNHLLFGSWEQAAYQRLNLCASKRDRVGIGQRSVI